MTDGLRGLGHWVVVIANNERGYEGPAKLVRWLRLQWQVRRAASRPGTVLVVQWVPAGVRALSLIGIHPRVAIALGSDIYLTTRESLRRRLRAALLGGFLRGSDAVLAPSVDLARAAVAAGARAERTSCVRFGVDLTEFAPGPDPVELRTRLGVGGARVVLSNRTIGPLYRHPTVIEALATLPDDVVLVMTRHLASAEELQAVERLAADLGVVDRIRIIPALPDADMPDLYRLADVVVSVPETDGGPATILEAMACGRQIVATDLPSVREMLGGVDPDGLVPVGDAGAVARAIRRALRRTATEREEIGRLERAAVQQRADRRAALEALEAIHRRLAPSRAGRALQAP
jgi:glycosyltransferase involved in cell wall biosynthesis